MVAICWIVGAGVIHSRTLISSNTCSSVRHAVQSINVNVPEAEISFTHRCLSIELLISWIGEKKLHLSVFSLSQIPSHNHCICLWHWDLVSKICVLSSWYSSFCIFVCVFLWGLQGFDWNQLLDQYEPRFPMALAWRARRRDSLIYIEREVVSCEHVCCGSVS